MLAHIFEPTFTGLCIHTIDNLNILMQQGYSDSWVLSKKRAESQNKVMFVSRNEIGYYLIAEVEELKEVEPISIRKRFRVRFANSSLQFKEVRDINFNRNPIAYH